MSKYTVELRQIVNEYGLEEVKNWFKEYNLNNYLKEEEIESINDAGLWDKDRLAEEIIDAYAFREIGLETPELFKHYVKVKMRKIMERKLPLIYSVSISYDPLINVDYSEVYTGSNTGTGNVTSNNTTDNKSLQVNSDTPQEQVDIDEILEGKYASTTSANKVDNESNDTSTSNTSGTTNYTKTIKGNSGVSATAQKMVQQYRDNIVSINEDIIDELDSLFMGIY